MVEQKPKPGKALDLLAAAQRMPAKYAKIAGMIRAASSAHSIRTDLETALDMLTALDTTLTVARSANGSRSWAADASLGLINAIVVLYVRATKSSSRHRRAIDFRKHYNEDQLELHARLCRLRDDAIAHFGPGNEYGGSPWQIEAVFLPVDRRDDAKIMTGSRRVIEQRQLQDELLKQLHRALMIAEKEAQRRISDLTDELNSSLADDELRNLLWDHEIDLVDFFESPEERDRVMGGTRMGHATGYVRH